MRNSRVNGNAASQDKKPQQCTVITSCLMVPDWLEKVKGGSGSILHGQVLPHSAGMRRTHSSQFSVERRLQVATLAPKKGRNVPGKQQEKHIVCQRSFGNTCTTTPQATQQQQDSVALNQGPVKLFNPARNYINSK